MEERIQVEVIDTVDKNNIDIITNEHDKFIISRLYNVSVPIDRIRYFEIIDYDQDSSKTDINLPPFTVVAYTNLDGLDSVPLEEYDDIQDAFDAMYDYSTIAFNKRKLED